jgi:uncharacterized protein YjbI with pentapeptide repeats
MTTVTITRDDLADACFAARDLIDVWLGQGGDWTGEWTVDVALRLAQMDGHRHQVGALGWLERRGLVPRVLSRADLSRADLSRADLSGADLSGADMRGADLRGAYLLRTRLVGARLAGTDLRGAYIIGAEL